MTLDDDGVRECSCPHVKHRHGTQRAYVADGCRCEACVRANFRTEKQRTHQPNPLVDPGPAQHHLRELLSDPYVTLETVSQASGLSKFHLSKINNGIPRNIASSTEKTILALSLSMVQRQRFVSAYAARLRLRALMVAGWSGSLLSRRTGVYLETVLDIVNGKKTTITVRVDDLISQSYERLWNVSPPERTRFERSCKTATIHRAQQRKWKGALDIEYTLQRLDAQRLPHNDKRETKPRYFNDNFAVDSRLSRHYLRDLMARGWSLTELSNETGISAYTLGRIAGKEQHRISRNTHDAVTSVYPQLQNRPPRHLSRRAINRAQHEGWTTDEA